MDQIAQICKFLHETTGLKTFIFHCRADMCCGAGLLSGSILSCGVSGTAGKASPRTVWLYIYSLPTLRNPEVEVLPCLTLR